MSTPAIGAGTVLGSARIEHFIGEGNVGTVWKAHHVGLGIDVAIKVLKPAPEGERQRFRERFQREARLIAKLNHPGIVRVLDCGEFHGTLYLVMEYVDGFTLEDFLRRRPGAVSETTGRKIIQATAMALSIAHEEGIIHRDLKPANLLIDKKGRLKIADFGLARERGGATLTMEKVAVGSPAYMSPEALQPDHGEPDQRSDLYALGIIAYQLAFGRLPYNGTMSQIVHGHLGGTARFDLPCEWSSQSIDMIRHLMEHDRTHRTATAKVVVEACLAISNGSTARTQRVARGTGTGSRAAAGSGELSGMVAFLEGALGENSSKVGGKTIVHTTARERLVVWGVLVGVLVLAIAGFVVFAPKRIGSEPGAVPPAPRSATSATSPSSP